MIKLLVILFIIKLYARNIFVLHVLKKAWFLQTHKNQAFYIFIFILLHFNNSRSKQNTKYLPNPFIDIIKWKISSKNMLVGVCQSF